MLETRQHKMRLVTTHPTGAEEWACPECGRRFVAQWFPKFRRVILEQGNAAVVHTGQGVGFQNQISIQGSSNDIQEDVELDDVWKRWLDKLDF